MDQQLRVLTLNCWGLPDVVTKLVYRKYSDPKVSKGRNWPKRTDRFIAIANKLDSFDVVCLQEVWIKKDQELLRSICKDKGLIYSHVFSSGLIGSSGLVIISRFPIKEVFFHKYRINGVVYRLDHGDYHAGKGFGFARLAISETQSISVIITHTIARYNQERDPYHADRISQVWELIRFLQLTSRHNQPVIVVGDMNSRPTSIEYSMFTQVGKLGDAFEEFTSVNPSRLCSSTSMDANPQRLDYIFFSKNFPWKVIDSKVVLNDTSTLYSDHFGVSATFSFGCSLRRDLVSSMSFPYGLNSLEDDENFEAGTNPQFKSAKAILGECLNIITSGAQKAANRKTNHIIRSLFTLFLIWIVVSFGAPFQIVAILASYSIAELFIALFPVENEISALREVHNEIKYFF